MTQTPYHFTYSDLLGRPATNAVKDTIANFLWEKCGEERYSGNQHKGRVMRLAFDEWKEEVFKKKLFSDVFELGKQQKIAATISGVRSPLGVSAHGFSHKRPAAEVPERRLKNKPDHKPR